MAMRPKKKSLTAELHYDHDQDTLNFFVFSDSPCQKTFSALGWQTCNTTRVIPISHRMLSSRHHLQTSRPCEVSSLLLRKKKKVVDPPVCVRRREIWVNCPSHGIRGTDVIGFGAAGEFCPPIGQLQDTRPRSQSGCQTRWKKCKIIRMC